MTQATTAVVTRKFADLTKEEKIAHVEKQIVSLNAKLKDIINDVVRVAVKKAIALPNIGDLVLFSRGRRTNTTEPVDTLATVVAIKPAVTLESGKTAPAQIKVQIGEGFDAEFVVIYPAQCQPVPDQAPNPEGGVAGNALAPAYQE